MPAFLRKLTEMHGQLPKHGFSEYGGPTGDRHVPSRIMEKSHAQIAEMLAAYAKNPTSQNLFRLYHAVDHYRAQGSFGGNLSSGMLDIISAKVRQSAPVKSLAKKLAKVDFNNLFVSRENAQYFLNESAFPHGGKKDIGFEASGCARIVKRENGFEIVPTIQSIEDHEPSTFIADLPHLFESGSQLFWHNHPAGSSQQRLSFGDEHSSDRIGIPIMMAMDARHPFDFLGSHKPVMEIHYNKKKYKIGIR